MGALYSTSKRSRKSRGDFKCYISDSSDLKLKVKKQGECTCGCDETIDVSVTNNNNSTYTVEFQHKDPGLGANSNTYATTVGVLNDVDGYYINIPDAKSFTMNGGSFTFTYENSGFST
jgi:hypothetical protein